MAEKTEKKYVITNHRSGKVLASCGGSAVQMTANGGETQVWCAVPAEGTSVQLVHKVSGLALTVPGEAENGTTRSRRGTGQRFPALEANHYRQGLPPHHACRVRQGRRHQGHQRCRRRTGTALGVREGR